MSTQVLEQEQQPIWTRPYTLTVLATLFIFIPYSLYMPVLPIYVLDELHGSVQVAGLMNAAFLIASVLFRTQTARLESVFGKRNILQASCFLYFLSNSLYLATTNISMILLIRFFSGICFAIVNTSIVAWGSQLIPEKRKGEGLAYLTTVVTAGSAIGPFIGLSLSQRLGFDWVFLFCGFTTLIGLIILFFIKTPNDKINSIAVLRRLELNDIIEVRVVPVSCVILLLSFAYSGVLSFVTVYANELNLLSAGTYFFVVSAAFSIASRLFTGQVFDRFGANVVIYPSILIFAIGLFVLSRACTSIGMLIAAACIGVAYGVVVPAIQTLAIQQAPQHRTSVVTATYFTCLDVGLGIGAYILGAVIPLLGYSNLYLLLCPIVLCIAFLYFWVYGRKAAAQGGQPSVLREDMG